MFQSAKPNKISENIKVPIKRFIDPAEAVPLALLLASDESEGITGQSINIDGGSLQY